MGILTFIFLKSDYASSSIKLRRLQPFIGLSGLIVFFLFVSIDYSSSDPTRVGMENGVSDLLGAGDSRFL
jgi:hypothetical protein